MDGVADIVKTIRRSQNSEKERRLENVATAMHCNLRPPDAAPVSICFNYDAMPSFKSLNLSVAAV